MTSRIVIDGSGARGLADGLAVARRSYRVRAPRRAVLSHFSLAAVIRRAINVFAGLKNSNQHDRRIIESALVFSLLH